MHTPGTIGNSQRTPTKMNKMELLQKYLRILVEQVILEGI